VIRIHDDYAACFKAFGFPVVSALAIGSQPPAALAGDLCRLNDWLEAGRHADLHYMAQNSLIRANPSLLFPEARSLFIVVVPYWNRAMEARRMSQRGTLPALMARYAQGADYHRVIRRRLANLIPELATVCGRVVRGRAVVDSAPFLERAIARISGLGFVGRSSLLIHPDLGGFTFLGALLTDLAPEEIGLPVIVPETGFPSVFGRDFCGRCRRCIDACPTGAIGENHSVNAVRCLSRLSIEFRGDVPPEFHPSFSETIYGCDRCIEVCPYTKRFLRSEFDLGPLGRAWESRIPEVALEEALAWSEGEFCRWFEGTAVMRLGYAAFLRNIRLHLAAQRGG
jgi:epoxyqueuosine reductase